MKVRAKCLTVIGGRLVFQPIALDDKPCPSDQAKMTLPVDRRIAGRVMNDLIKACLTGEERILQISETDEGIIEAIEV